MMTKEEAVEVIEGLLFSVQKFRSNSREAMSHMLGDLATSEDVDEMLVDMYPWVYGSKSIMHGLIKALEIYRRDGTLEPMTVRNFLVIALRLESHISFAYHVRMDEELPAINTVPYLEWE